MTPRNRLHMLALAALACLSTASMAQDSFPSKNITLVVPFGSASGTDFIARVIAKNMQDSLGVPVVVDNKPGANGAIGASAVARAQADGYTLLIGSATTNAVNYFFFPGKLGYEAASFAPVAGLSAGPISLYVPTASPWKTLAELVAAGKASGQPLNCGSGNAVTQVACEVFRQQEELDAVNIPYKSNPQSLTDLAGGQLAYAFSDPGAAQTFIEGQKVRPLAVAALQRHGKYPDTPTFSEQGVKNFVFTGWTAAFAPAGTPLPVLEKLNAAFRKAMAAPNTVSLLQRSGSGGMDLSLEDSRRFVADEIARWSHYIQISHVKPE